MKRKTGYVRIPPSVSKVCIDHNGNLCIGKRREKVKRCG